MVNGLIEARWMSQDWLYDYMVLRPHEALGNLAPRQYLMAKCSNCSLLLNGQK